MVKISTLNAIVTSDSKILVFLCQVYFYDQSDCDSKLFDLNTQIWHTLTSLLYLLTRSGVWWNFCHKFNFVKEKYFVQRTEVGIFSLNLNSPKNWKKIWILKGWMSFLSLRLSIFGQEANMPSTLLCVWHSHAWHAWWTN